MSAPRTETLGAGVMNPCPLTGDAAAPRHLLPHDFDYALDWHDAEVGETARPKFRVLSCRRCAMTVKVTF